jgi:hypothetical protein
MKQSYLIIVKWLEVEIILKIFKKPIRFRIPIDIYLERQGG